MTRHCAVENKSTLVETNPNVNAQRRVNLYGNTDSRTRLEDTPPPNGRTKKISGLERHCLNIAGVLLTHRSGINPL